MHVENVLLGPGALSAWQQEYVLAQSLMYARAYGMPTRAPHLEVCSHAPGAEISFHGGELLKDGEIEHFKINYRVEQIRTQHRPYT